MALNIKDADVDRMAGELARQAGHGNKTRAVRDALRAQLDEIQRQTAERRRRLLEVLRTEIWPSTEPEPPALTKAHREELLGYDAASGVSA